MDRVKTVIKGRRDSVLAFGIVIVAYIVMQLLVMTGNISNSLSGMLVPICAYIVMAVSLNLTVGILGELSLGHAGFMSVGAFTGIVVTTALAMIRCSCPRTLRARRWRSSLLPRRTPSRIASTPSRTSRASCRSGCGSFAESFWFGVPATCRAGRMKPSGARAPGRHGRAGASTW